MLRSFGLVLAAVVPTLACSEDIETMKPSSVDATCQSSLAGDAGAPDQACKFSHQPVTLKIEDELLHVRSERLAAPPGGHWWLAEPPTSATVIAQSESLGPIELEAVDNPDRKHKDFTILRVPERLPVGTRLRIGCRQLVVEAAQPAFKATELTLAYAHRPELGGAGFIARMPPALRKRIFIEDAYVGPSGAAIIIGLHVLHGLLLADAPSLCGVAVAPEASEVFVPMRGGAPETDALGIFWVDADDLKNSSWTRLCNVPDFRCSTSTE